MTLPDRSDSAKTDDVLAQVVLAAEVFVRIESARLYGLIVGGPAVNLARIDEVFAEADRRGLARPSEDEIVNASRGVFLACGIRWNDQ